MKKIIIIALIFFSYQLVNAEQIEVEFKKCVDGDTMQIMIGNVKKRLRLLAIDTPESVADNNLFEPYGKEASQYTCEALKKAEKITIEYDPKSDREDKYGRLLAYVYVDGKMLQEQLLAMGYAKVAYIYDDYLYYDKLKAIEKDAQDRQVGIWSNEPFDKEIEMENVEEEINNIFTKIWEFFKKIFCQIKELFD